jgi:hypothetical protein
LSIVPPVVMILMSVIFAHKLFFEPLMVSSAFLSTTPQNQPEKSGPLDPDIRLRGTTVPSSLSTAGVLRTGWTVFEGDEMA